MWRVPTNFTTWHETLEFLKQGVLFWDFGGQTVQQLNSRWLGWSWFKGLGKVPSADSRASFFLASWLGNRFSNIHPPPTSHQGNWSGFLSPISYIHEFFVVMSPWLSLMAMKQLVQPLRLKSEWDQIISSLWCGCSPITRMGTQGFKTFDLFSSSPKRPVKISVFF